MELERQAILPSAYEVGKEWFLNARNIEMTPHPFVQTLVITFSCQRCGKLKIDKTRS